MSWTPYDGDEYVDFEYVATFCRQLANCHPDWAGVDIVGQSHQDRPLMVLTLGASEPGPDGSKRGGRPALWLDAGTHASEWTGISAVLYVVSQWIEALNGGDETLQRWFSTHDVVVMPCISPDGVQAMSDGKPFLRSSLSPPHDEQVRSGLDPCDINDDGTVRMMRWKHPAGSFVKDEQWAPFMRPRTLDDDPEDAYFLCDEGEFINWDGVRWTRASREYGIDLNRNFPGHWQPFSMFGMHGGQYPLSEPESRAVADAFASHEHIGCALTMHTYTGCILTQPYRKDTPLSKTDIRLMEQLADDLAADTGYDVYRVYPDFMYEKDQSIVGVWADTMASVFGVPGYTVELWDPLGYADLEVDNPVEFLMRPDPENMCTLLQKFAENDANIQPWKTFDHPQLGEVEIGGIEYLRTIRNPPEDRLVDECEKAFLMAERARKSLPEVTADVEVTSVKDADAHRIRLVLENEGFLSTSGLDRGADVSASPPVSARMELSEKLSCEHPEQRQLEHLHGWGSLKVGSARNPVYAGLPTRGHRQYVEWTVRGQGQVTIVWQAGRGGSGVESIEL